MLPATASAAQSECIQDSETPYTIDYPPLSKHVSLNHGNYQVKVVISERDSEGVATKTVNQCFGQYCTIEAAKRVAEEVHRLWPMIRNPRHNNLRDREYVRGVLTAEQNREIYRQAVKGLEESSRLGVILEVGNAEGEEELNEEGASC